MDKNKTEQAEDQMTEEVDFTKPNFLFVPKAVHDWKQEGCYLICRSCDLEHAMYIGMRKLLTGINEETHEPILEERKLRV